MADQSNSFHRSVHPPTTHPHTVKLTIAIPTYNRLRQLRTTVQLLLPQLTPDVVVTIIDNASPKPVTLEELQVTPSHQGTVRVRRNRFNIGGVANMLRCLETCETDYVWVLGDDDYPADDCIDTIVSAIRSAPNALNYNFADTRGRCFQGVSHGLSDFVRTIDHWSAILYISSNIYNAKRLQPFLPTGYEFAYSYAPLAAILIDALRVQGGQVVFSSRKIVTGNQPGCETPWSAVTYIMRRYAILDLPMERSVRLCLGRKITNFAGDINPPFLFFVSDPGTDHSDTMEDIISRSFRYLSTSGKLRSVLFWVLIHFPRLSWFFIVRLFPRSKVSAIIDREAKAATL